MCIRDRGINFFDTARGYQGGNNERMVGAALKSKRKQVYISTKTGARSKEEALADLDTSLKELGIVLDAAKNDRNEREIGSGRIRLLVVPTSEERAIARDTKRILEAMARTHPAAATPSAASLPAALAPDETAKLVLLWAKTPKAEPAVLARRLGRALGLSLIHISEPTRPY